MKKNNIIIAIIGIAIVFIFAIVGYFQYKAKAFMIIYTPENSYAQKYAKQHFFETYITTSTEIIQQKLSLQLEGFSYNINDDKKEITITKYNGISEKLVIPEYIKDYKVTKIDKDFLKDNTNVKSIVISKFISSLGEKELKDIEINCYSSDYCNKIKKNEDLNVVIMSDSVITNFDNSATNFSYEYKGDGVELINYYGNEEMTIVPTKINGYPVTIISFDKGPILKIFIPNTVNNISENFSSTLFNRIFISMIAALGISLLLFLINVITNSNKSLEDASKNTILYIVSVLFLLTIGILSLRIKDYFVGYKDFVFKSTIIVVVYIVLCILLKVAKKGSKNFEQKAKQNKEFINEVLLLLENNEDLRANNVKELIKYSDPISIKKTFEIESKIKNILKQESIGKEDYKTTEKLIKERNLIIKQEKM